MVATAGQQEVKNEGRGARAQRQEQEGMKAGPPTRKRAQDSTLAMKGNLEGTNDSISNLDGYAFLSLCGAGTQVGGAHHILPVHQGAVRWRRLHIEHIQGCLPNGMHFSTPTTSPKSCFAV